MAEDNRIEVEIVLNDGSIQKGFLKLEQQAQKTAVGFGNMYTKVAAVAAAIIGGFSFEKAIDGAIESEKASVALNAALSLTGKFTKEASEQFQNFASEIQKTKGVSDELILTNAAQLATLNKLSGEGLQKATIAALDLATALQVGPEKGFDLVSKALAGNTDSLSKYGIKIDELRARTEGISYVAGEIEKRFGGLSDQMSGTFSGALKKASLGFDEIFESIGKVVTKSPAVVGILTFVAKSAFELAESIEKFSSTGGFNEIVQQLLVLAQAINKYVVAPFEIAFNFIRIGLNGVALIIAGVIDIFPRMLNALVENFFSPALGIFANFSQKVLGFFDEKFALRFSESIRSVQQNLTDVSKNVSDTTAQILSDTFDKTLESTKTAFDTGISDSLGGYVTKLQDAAENTKIATGEMKNGIQEVSDKLSTFQLVSQGFSNAAAGMKFAAEDFVKNSSARFQEFGKAAFQSLGQGVGNAFAQMGKAIVQGKDAFKEFGKALLQALGQQAINMGTLFIMQGTAALFAPAIATSLGITNPAGLIAAGAALATFGGVLSALGGGGDTAPTPSASGGGVVASQSSGQDNVLNSGGQVAQQRGSDINVVINGSVFDTQETGLRITEILKDSFAQQGLVTT